MDVFRSALESSLPAEMRPQDQGKPVQVEWDGGQYQTAADFDKREYLETEAPELNFVVVGHNQMMSEYCLAPKFLPKPNNNAVLEKMYILELPERGVPHQSVTMRELRGKCRLVMGAPKKEASFSELATSDVVGCSRPFGVSNFMDLKEGVNPEDTACVKCAPESAFPIQPDFL